MNRELEKKLRNLYSDFREANKLVTQQINLNNYTHEDVVETDESYTAFYEAVDEIRDTLGKILDDIDQGFYDEEKEK